MHFVGKYFTTEKQKEVYNLSITNVFGDMFGPVRPDELTTKRPGPGFRERTFVKYNRNKLGLSFCRLPRGMRTESALAISVSDTIIISLFIPF